MKKILGTLLIIAGLSVFPAQAAAPTYSYLDFAFLSSEIEPDGGAKSDADGGRFNFNVSLERWLYFTGEYNHADFNDSDLQLRDTSAGFGVHSRKNKYQLFTALTYERSDVKGADATDEGYGLQLGVRVPFLDRYEAQLDYKYLDLGDDAAGEKQDFNRLRLTAQARLTPVWAFIASFQTLDSDAADQTDWTAGFRAYFKTQYDVQRRRKPSASAAE